jgi:hypothetical protein
MLFRVYNKMWSTNAKNKGKAKVQLQLCQLPIVPAQKKTAHAVATAKHALPIIKKKMKCPFAPGSKLAKKLGFGSSRKKRERANSLLEYRGCG